MGQGQYWNCGFNFLPKPFTNNSICFPPKTHSRANINMSRSKYYLQRTNVKKCDKHEKAGLLTHEIIPCKILAIPAAE